MDNNIGQLKELFFNNPEKSFHIREIERILKIAKSTISYAMKQLIDAGIVIKESDGVFPNFRASNNEKYIFYKKICMQEKIMQSEVITYLETACNPKCIILFGSCAKGEYTHESDVDLFVQSDDQKIELKKYEKMLGKKINVLFDADINNMSDELYNNMINGIKLRGYIHARDHVLGRMQKPSAKSRSRQGQNSINSKNGKNTSATRPKSRTR